MSRPEHLRSPPVFSGVCVTRSLVLYVCFVDRCLSFCTFFFWPLCCLFFFDIRILITPLESSNSFFISQGGNCTRIYANNGYIETPPNPYYHKLYPLKYDCILKIDLGNDYRYKDKQVNIR
jgi:hypothetical protein